MRVRTFTGGGFGENAYLAVCEASGAAVAIDPGSGAPDLARAVESEGLDLPALPEPTHEFVPGEPYEFGDCVLEVRNTPGHAPGHVTLYDPDAGVAFVGDVVFHGSIGRTDLPGGDLKTLMKSIREEILTLPDDTVLYSGHGPPTTVGTERIGNPFLIPHYGGELA